MKAFAVSSTVPSTATRRCRSIFFPFLTIMRMGCCTPKEIALEGVVDSETDKNIATWWPLFLE